MDSGSDREKHALVINKKSSPGKSPDRKIVVIIYFLVKR